MQALGDYGSDSEEEAAPASTNITSKKRERGPVKIMLDLPAPKTNSVDEQPSKRPKLDFGGKGAKSGLAAMLPAPRKTVAVAGESSNSLQTTGHSTQIAENPTLNMEDDITTNQETPIPQMIPKAVKRKPVTTETNLFGLPTGPIASTSTSQASASVNVSSAPKVKDAVKVNYYATLPPANPDNPYPGFHCLPSGQWVANEPADWEEFARENGWASGGTSDDRFADAQDDLSAQPGFEGADLSNMHTFDPSKEKAEKAKVPEKISKIVPLDEEAEEKKRQQLARFTGRARGKNQLSSLLGDAMRRREELEERIAVAKANKRAGGAKCE